MHKKILLNTARSICFLFFKIKNKQKIYIFDLDNTLANTWISYNMNYRNDKERLSSLAVFLGMKKLIEKTYLEGHYVVVLTAREYWHYFITKKWLFENNISYNNLTLVSHPSQKLELLKKLKIDYIYFDDLTYNHENGELKFYTKIIHKISIMKNVKYYGYEEINKINGVEA